jgi:3-phosphoshikimate 1-carboxyvinyltransferase
MVECLQELGFMINVAPDPEEFCNRTITVYGQGGHVPRGGTEQQPLELFVGNAGTAARFLAAMVCLGEGVYRLHGVPRMHERPQAALFAALRQLGYRIDSQNDRLPALIHGAGPKPGAACSVSIEESSQFASALLLCAKVGGWKVEVVGENAEESPYVAMTSELIKAFPAHGGEFQIEPDASSGSYFWAIDWVLWITHVNDDMGQVTVRHWPKTTWQIDSRYPEHRNLSELKGVLSRKIHLGDSIMTAIVKAPFNLPPVGVTGIGQNQPMRFTDLGRLRLQETERVHALRTELSKCGVRVVESGDTLEVFPVFPHAPQNPDGSRGEIETYNDHRMAMCFAVLGLKVSGIKLRNPSCVKKTFPNFFQKLAAEPPLGLGVQILEVPSRRVIPFEDLFAG